MNERKTKKLKELCIKYNIPTTFPALFNEKEPYPMWSFSRDGIGLTGTEVMRYFSRKGIKIFLGANELEKFLNNDW